jgi:hypothetical protein
MKDSTAKDTTEDLAELWVWMPEQRQREFLTQFWALWATSVSGVQLNLAMTDT